MKWLKLSITFTMFLVISSCNDDDNLVTHNVEDFVWKAMNSWYYWYENVDNLQDSFDDDLAAYNTYIKNFASPNALFENLLYQPNEIDKYSFMVNDYTDLQNYLQGITESFGHDFRLLPDPNNNDNLFGYVRYVIPNTPADQAGIKRGDLFNTIDGQQLTRSNYFSLLFQQMSYKIGFADIVNGEVVSNGEEATMTAQLIDENPVLLTKRFDLANGKKVGYLVYNQFSSQHNDELNAAFAQLKAENVTDLVLDLRYNGGGSILTSSYLASMIYSTNDNQIFSTSKFNNKHSQFNKDYKFSSTLKIFNTDGEETGEESINSLGLNSIIILTSGSTASASELIINGLKPYMSVTLIGSTTVGKNVGSVTLYDAPNSNYLNKNDANPNHKYALQPIVSSVVNSQGFGEYTSGFAPDQTVNELSYIANLQPLGDEQEPLLQAALANLCPSCRIAPPNENFNITGGETIIERKSAFPGYQVMPID